MTGQGEGSRMCPPTVLLLLNALRKLSVLVTVLSRPNSWQEATKGWKVYFVSWLKRIQLIVSGKTWRLHGSRNVWKLLTRASSNQDAEGSQGVRPGCEYQGSLQVTHFF